MKKLNKAFVIVKTLTGGEFDFFQDTVSFDKKELDIKCDRMNRKENNKGKKYFKNNKLTAVTYTFYEVMDLKSAIEKYRVEVADAHTEQDESM
jgi:hypothetical protein